MSLAPRRARTGRPIALLGALLVGAGLGGCGDAGEGVAPPPDRIFFPSGLALDPRVPAGAPARWLFVANANSDLVYNAGTIAAIDLDAFFAAWADVELVSGPPPRFHVTARAGIADVGAATTSDAPCRRIAGAPQAIECDERPFVEADATAKIGSFSTVVRPWDRRSLADKAADPGAYELRLFVPVRGDPSVTYVDVEGGLGGAPLRITCTPDPEDPSLCALRDRTRFLRGSRDFRRLGREPLNMLVGDRVALVTHGQAPEVSLFSLYGLDDAGEAVFEAEPDRERRAREAPYSPILADVQRLFGAETQVGGLGLAERPCSADNAPQDTYVDGVPCARPLYYAGNRADVGIVRFSVGRITPIAGQRCVGVDDLDQEGAVLCDDRLVRIDGLFVSGYDPGPTSAASLGELAFSGDGDRLYVVQSNPGALVRVDTSLNERGETRDVATGIVEVCARPTALLTLRDGPTELAAVSCYSSGAIFIVELSSMRVVEQVYAGVGVHQMVHDPVRGFIYAANTLDATISVIDVASYRPTRFTQVARIGLQEPYTG